MENTCVGQGMLIKDIYPETTVKESIHLKSASKDKSMRVQEFLGHFSLEKEEEVREAKQDKHDLESICRY